MLSPDTAAVDRSDKMPIFARHGVRQLWLVDPLIRTLEAYRLESERYSALGTWRDDVTASIEPFDAVPFELAALWSK